MPYLFWLLLASIFLALGEFMSKKFALAPSGKYIFLIILFYTLNTLAWLPAILQKKDLSIVGII